MYCTIQSLVLGLVSGVSTPLCEPTSSWLRRPVAELVDGLDAAAKMADDSLRDFSNGSIESGVEIDMKTLPNAREHFIDLGRPLMSPDGGILEGRSRGSTLRYELSKKLAT